MADNNKIVTLGNIAILKDYINRNIEKASKMLNEEYESQFDILQSSITALENLGTLDELSKLQLKLDALNANFEDKKEALELLKNDFENLSNGITDGTVFSAGQLNEIISTALIDDTVITDDMVSTENVFTQKIVALIGNFGKINAGQVEAGTLKGSNIESTNKINYTSDPVWRLNNNGSGWLANKNISWDEDGNVTFGSGVSLDWSNIDSSGINTELEELSNKITDVQNTADTANATANAANTAANTATATANSANATANAANTTASTANATANAANTTANNANTTANNANTTANNANATANTAKSTADTAKSTADTANSIAAAAKQLAEEAKAGTTNVQTSIQNMQTRIDGLNNFSQKQIEDFSTKITKDTVTTAYVNALNVKAATIEADGLKAHAGYIKELAVDDLVAGSITAEALTAHAGYIKELAVDNLVVDKLNTDPDGTIDKIEISDNHLYCVNSDGKNNLIISSKEISTGVINALGDNQIGNDTPTTSRISLSNFIKLYDKASLQGGAFSKIDNIIMRQNINKNDSYQEPATIIIPSQPTGFKQQSIQELGTYFSGATIWVKPHLSMDLISNGMIFTLKKDSWDISCRCVVKLYKKKTRNDSWKNVTSYNTTGDNVFLQANNPYTIKNIDGESQSIDGSGLFANFNISLDRSYINRFSNVGSNGNTSIQITPRYEDAIKQYASWIRFDIDETCIYGINIELESSFIAVKSGNNADNIPFNVNQGYPIWISFNKDKEGGPIVGNDNANKDIDTLINANDVKFNLFASYIMDVENNNKPASYTELGKDGVVVYDGRHLLSLYSDGVEMKANSDDKNLGTTFYGFKVTKDGLYYCNGGSDYTKWTPS